MEKNLGHATAYGYAKSKGYTGTEEEFETLMASYATVAEEAAESAESASQSATQAGASAQTATTKASEASTSATQAGASATSASQSAQTATTKASEASASASTAGTKANEASTSASTASSKASEASASATSAQTAQGLAESARDDAVDAKTDAETARDMAQQYAESIDPEKIYSAYPTDTASGSVASFADGADDIPMKSVKVAIEPVQSGSGDPSPDNVRPISGWTGAQVVRSGVNVWDEEYRLGFYNSNGVFVANTNGYFSNKNLIPVKPNSECALCIKGASNQTIYMPMYYRDGTFKTRLGYTLSGGVRIITVPEDVYFIGFSTETFYGTTYNHDISINYPSTDHDYHSFKGNDTYSITFPAEAGTVYGGELDVTNGVLTVDRAMVDLGTLTWTHLAPNDTRPYDYFSVSVNDILYWTMGDAASPYVISSSYRVVTSVQVAREGYDKTLAHINSLIFIANSDYSDAAAFKTAMDGEQLCYELATPITYHLTSTEIKSLLGDNNVWADAGDTEVIYRADPNLYIDKRIGTEAPMVATDNIVSGSYFMVGNNLYKATANIASGASVIVGTNAVAMTMAEALNEINV